ncbi:hypothetical protein AAFF_G00383510 [Aldrovandia affinis]|uniref:F-box domain-containing protein n=1 Tax=Aldrovandia affinis TaxID=143900 RepID=A0AAD7SF32_9TELE|nr:hypothetical protein AAFF_G00383510 [Aldrovandia affinis]
MEDSSHNVSSVKVELMEVGEEVLPKVDCRAEFAGAGSSDSYPPGMSGRGAMIKKSTVKISSLHIDAKNKRKKKSKVKRTPTLGYTVQQGEDMLLIISNNLQTKACKRRKIRKVRAKLPTAKVKRKTSKAVLKDKVFAQDKELKPIGHHSHEGYGRWGQNLPVEVLVNIFELVVKQEGAIPFLCRAARVCQLWNGAAANPALWCSVTVGYCWIEPGKTQSPKTELKVQDTVRWLAQNRFSQLREFGLCHWKKHVDYVVQVVSQHCPQLSALKLSHCSGVTEKAFQSLGRNCPSLESIDMQYSEVQTEGLVSFLEMHGSRIRKILFTYGVKSDRLLSVLAGGCSPELKLLEINTKLDSGYCQLPICIQALQSGCPKLQVFRMLNVTAMPKMARRGPCSASGFPDLEELCMASSSVSFFMDHDLNTLLHGSPNLRVLDLRGCTRITPAALSMLPCPELECLYWGLYFSSNSMPSSKKGIHLLTEKWSRTLQELDLSSQPFSEQDLEVAMGDLAHSGGAKRLRSLNLSGTKITSNALRSLISQCSGLNYLNLSSCRYLPRGLKKVYRSQEDIQQLLDKLP